MRRAILFGLLIFAVGCSGDATAPRDTVDPEPPQFEAVGEYYLYVAGDSLICGEDGCLARTISSYVDSIGYWIYTLLVGPGGRLSLYPDSTYTLAYKQEMSVHPADGIGVGPVVVQTVNLAGRWTGTGTTYDTLSFTNQPFKLNILRGVLGGEFARRITNTGAIRITPLYIGLDMDNPQRIDWVPFITTDTVSRLTFRREDG